MNGNKEQTRVDLSEEELNINSESDQKSSSSSNLINIPKPEPTTKEVRRKFHGISMNNLDEKKVEG